MSTSPVNLLSQVSISSSSWVHVGGGEGAEQGEARQVTEEREEKEELEEREGDEPVKPPRLKKLARQQSKQELLRAKGFGLGKSSLALVAGEAPKTIKGLQARTGLDQQVRTGQEQQARTGQDQVGQHARARPEISTPTLIGSTLNSEDLELHKCITLHR